VFLVLIAFVGVIGYIIYDNYTYKNDLTTDLNTNFKGINKNFVSTTNVIEKVHMKHSSNLNALGETLINTSNLLDDKIDDVYTKNLASHVVIDKGFDDFGYNMNRYFKFNNADNNTPNINKKIFEYRTLDSDKTARLNLITQTTAVAGLKINSDATNSFQICNSNGEKCFEVLSTDDSLSIYKPVGMLGKSDIYIGGKDATAPFAIVDGKTRIDGKKIEVKADGKLYIDGAIYPAAPVPSAPAPPAPAPVAPEATATLTATTIASIPSPVSSVVYTSVPTVTITGGGSVSQATATATLSGTSIASIGVPSSVVYTSKPTVTITGGGGPTAGTTVDATFNSTTGAVTAIATPSLSVLYTSVPTVTITGGGGPAAGTTVTPTLTATSIASITVPNTGAVYTSVPTVTITGGGGPAAGTTVTPTLTATTLGTITPTSQGSGYTVKPTVVITPANGASATAVLGTGATAGKVTSITVDNRGTGFTSVPAITFNGGS
jgi:hypothetical protein